jgi:hypothetical protein
MRKKSPIIRGSLTWILLIVALTTLMLIAGAYVFFYRKGVGKVATKAIKIGNPSLNQFPDDNSKDCYARSVWDMHHYQGRIYIGSGDMIRNRGPINIWSFTENGRQTSFQKEITVDEEQVHLFRSYEGKLFVPGMDAKESWDFGNFYIKEAGTWKKLRTIPRGLHIFDIAFFDGNLYVYMTSDGYVGILESKDMGQTWEFVRKELAKDRKIRVRFGPLVALKDFLFLTARIENTTLVFKYANGNLEKLRIPLFPSSENKRKYVKRLIPFKNGVLYAPVYLAALDFPCPLFFLDDLKKGAASVEQFQKDFVRDIVVRGGKCYVLTASSKENYYTGTIYSSKNLTRWKKVAEFSMPALPYSFELLNGNFYIGLGHQFFPDKWQAKEEGWAKGSESGSIWRITKLNSNRNSNENLG